MANAKCRMTLRKEEEERLDDDDEGIGEGEEEDEDFEEEMEKLDAQSRQSDPKTRTFNDGKRRATDI